jgi:GT2 family glycosyltransferase
VLPSSARLDRRGSPRAEAGGSTDQDVWLVLIRTGGNLGFAGGNNVGLRYLVSRGNFDYVWLLNNDTVVAPDAMSALLRRMGEKTSAGMCGSTLLHYDDPDRVQACGGGYYCRWIGLPWHLGQLRSAARLPSVSHVERWMNYVVGASLLVSKKFLEEVGLLSEDYFLYFEETDWALRSKGRFTMAYAPNSLVYHKIGRSIGTRTDPRHKSLVCDYYAIRNRLLFTRRYFPLALPTIYLSVFTALVVRLLLGRAQQALMIWKLLCGSNDSFPAGGHKR